MKPKRIYISELTANSMDVHSACTVRVRAYPSPNKEVEYLDVSSMWHDKTDAPVVSTKTCLLVRLGSEVTTMYVYPKTIWKEFSYWHRIEKWAYLDDFVPSANEKRGVAE